MAGTRHILDLPDAGLTVLVYETTQRAVLIGQGGLTTVSLSWTELVKLCTMERQARAETAYQFSA